MYLCIKDSFTVDSQFMLLTTVESFISFISFHCSVPTIPKVLSPVPSAPSYALKGR